MENKRFEVALYDGAGHSRSYFYHHLENAIERVEDHVGYDEEMLSQFSVIDHSTKTEIGRFVAMYIKQKLDERITFDNLNVGDALYIIGWNMGGYANKTTIASIEKEGEHLLITTTDNYHYRVEPNETVSWDEVYSEDVLISADDALTIVKERIKNYQDFLSVLKTD